MNSHSARASANSLPPDQISRAVGDVTLPGELPDFIEALTREKRNVVRTRRGVDARELPFPTSPVPWYELGHQPVPWYELGHQPVEPGREHRTQPAANTEPIARPSRWLAYAAADYYIQDAGSLLALAAAGADTSSLAGALICDLCAAPGGKASALVEAISDVGSSSTAGFVLANEAIGSRIGALRLNLARTGSNRYAISNLDPDSLADRFPGVFDLVVVDAPCSGQALLGRGKQKVASLASNQILHSASRQQRILDAAVRLLRDGGTLIYSTCTFAQAENEAQVHRLVASGIADSQRVEKLAHYESAVAGRPSGCYRLWPHLHDCAGSFAASISVTRPSDERHRYRGKRAEKMPVDLTPWYELASESMRLSLHDSVIFGWPSDAPAWADEIAVGGPELAHRTGKTWKPAHAGALRRGENERGRQEIEVEEETAKVFLRGEPIPCANGGWHVVRLRGRPLGWIKGSGSIGKNHLPAAARVLGDLST